MRTQNIDLRGLSMVALLAGCAVTLIVTSNKSAKENTSNPTKAMERVVELQTRAKTNQVILDKLTEMGVCTTPTNGKYICELQQTNTVVLDQSN